MKYEVLDAKDAFLSLPEEEYPTYQDARAVVIPYGLEKSVSYKGGTKNAPKAILEASAEVELFDEALWCEPYRKIGIVTLKEMKIPEDMSKAVEKLEAITGDVLRDGKFPIILGGEHSITAGSIRPFVQNNEKITILHFDAHADLRDGYEGEHYSHASALRRCLDYENVELVSFGIRNISAEEAKYLDKNKDRVKIFWGKDRKSWNQDEIAKLFTGKTIYLTVDVDGFDASLMPATGTPEPGGMFWDDVVDIITRASKEGKIIGADINELSPIEGFHACDFLAAKLCYKILGLAL